MDLLVAPNPPFRARFSPRITTLSSPFFFLSSSLSADAADADFQQ
jgi:hypothetical protein